MRWSCLSAVVMDTRPKPTGSRSFFARSSRRMSSKVGGTRTMGPVKEVGPAVLKAGEVVPAMGWPPRKGNPYCSARGKTFWHTFSLVPAQSMTMVWGGILGASRSMCSTTASG